MTSFITIMGRQAEDWRDIYCLLRAQGKEPKSLADLYVWRAPLDPDECLTIGLQLIEARRAHSSESEKVFDWLENLVRQSASTIPDPVSTRTQ